MNKYPFYLVNVFAQSHFGGNPLAVFPNADGLTSTQMQNIAQQFNLSETVFITKPSDKSAVADLCIFTPSNEMAFAGHPTLGSAFLLKQLYHLPDEFILNTKAKPVQIIVNHAHIQLKMHGFKILASKADKSSLAHLSGLKTDDIAGQAYFVNSGTPQILMELNSRGALTNSRIDVAQLCLLNAQSPFQSNEPSIYLWYADGDKIFARMFFLQNGVMIEDSGTGSACANLGAYFTHHHRYPISTHIHQGDDMGRASRLSLTVDGEQNILVGGNVIMVGKGEFYV